MSTPNQIYQDRKQAGLCIRCGATATDDSLYCAPHHRQQLEYAKTSKAKLRADRRARGECAFCGEKSKRYRCRKCRGSSGVQSGVQIKRPPRQVAASRTWRDAGNRSRYHGRMRRGAPSQADLDSGDLRFLRSALDKADEHFRDAQDPEVAHLPRIQRDARRQLWLADVVLLYRATREMLQRCKVAIPADIDDADDGAV